MFWTSTQALFSFAISSTSYLPLSLLAILELQLPFFLSFFTTPFLTKNSLFSSCFCKLNFSLYGFWFSPLSAKFWSAVTAMGPWGRARPLPWTCWCRPITCLHQGERESRWILTSWFTDDEIDAYQIRRRTRTFIKAIRHRPTQFPLQPTPTTSDDISLSCDQLGNIYFKPTEVDSQETPMKPPNLINTTQPTFSTSTQLPLQSYFTEFPKLDQPGTYLKPNPVLTTENLLNNNLNLNFLNHHRDQWPWIPAIY